MKKIVLTAIVGLSGLLGACGSEPDKCYNGQYRNVTAYEISADRHTPKGIGIDDPANQSYVLSVDEVDWQVDDLEQCLRANFAKNPKISSADASPERGNCIETDFSKKFEIKRECVTVKVPDDLYTSQCSGKLLFKCDVDSQLCADKGLSPNQECPCACRATVQDQNYIITEPRLEAFRGELARVITGCNNPWLVEQIVGCLTNPHFSGP